MKRQIDNHIPTCVNYIMRIRNKNKASKQNRTEHNSRRPLYADNMHMHMHMHMCMCMCM
jgi:hypothetical protein